MTDCETCKNVKSDPENVPYIVHEASMARMERQIKRLWITVLFLIPVLASHGFFRKAKRKQFIR